MSPPLQIFFIRHGETAWSISGQHTGRTELALTPHGESMARKLAPRLKGIPFSLVLSSPRLRARKTCELAGLAAAAQIETNLAEWDYGDYEGLRTSEIRNWHPDWNIWEDGCPGGEMPAEVARRADHLIARLQDVGGKVLLFSHGQFGRALAVRWIGLPLVEGQHFAIDPASIGILSVETHPPSVGSFHCGTLWQTALRLLHSQMSNWQVRRGEGIGAKGEKLRQVQRGANLCSEDCQLVSFKPVRTRCEPLPSRNAESVHFGLWRDLAIQGRSRSRVVPMACAQVNWIRAPHLCKPVYERPSFLPLTAG